MGDTSARLSAARKNVAQLEEQKRIIENDLSITSGISGIIDNISSATIDQLKEEKEQAVQARMEAQTQHDDLQKHLLQLNEKIKASTSPRRANNKKNAKKSVDVDICTRIKNIRDFDPNDIGMVWNWSQSTRLEDLMNEIKRLEEHKKLLGNRRDSLERKIEQLIAINKNLDANIVEYNKVIESAKEKQGQIQSSDDNE